MNTWFKNITAYRLRARIAVLHDMLADHPFTPCPPSEMSRMGWVDPFGTLGDGSLVRFVNGSMVIKLKREERILPPYVINEHLGNRIRVIESEQMRKVTRKEKDELKEQIIHELLPRAFTKSTYTSAMITRDGWLIVGSKSKDAELLTSFLRKTLGSLPIRLAVTNISPSANMTNWVSGETEPRNFDVESQCELREIGGDEVIKCKNLAMPNDEVTAHIKSGMQVVNLALSWNDRVSFILNEDLTISSLKYTDLLQDQLDDQMIEDNTLYLEASLILMNECYSQMLNALLDEFGGEYVEPNGEN